MRLYLDACSIIYAVEGLPQFRTAVIAHISATESSPGGALLTSQLSKLECRVKPLRDAQAALVAQYDSFFAIKTLQLLDISSAIIERATQLRATFGFKTPDAIHLATAIEHQADSFLTGDANLARCSAIHVEVL